MCRFIQPHITFVAADYYLRLSFFNPTRTFHPTVWCFQGISLSDSNFHISSVAWHEGPGVSVIMKAALLFYALALFASVVSSHWEAITVVSPSNDGTALAGSAIAPIYNISDAPLSFLDAKFQGATSSSGIFTNGPWNMLGGAILTTGMAVEAASGVVPAGTQSTNNNAIGSNYCSPDQSYNAAVLSIDLNLASDYVGLSSTLVYASKYVPVAHTVDGGV